MVAIVTVVAVIAWVLLRSPGGAPPVTRPPVTAPSTAATDVPTRNGTPAPSTLVPSPEIPPGSPAPLPGTVSPLSVTPASPEPDPVGSAAAGTIELNDARFEAPDGWTLEGDEMIENARRTVRLSDPVTDARLQAVTLEGGQGKLTDSCVSLVDLQQTQFVTVTPQLVVPIGVEAAAGVGVRCGFHGERSSDGVGVTVTFTLVSRASDSHVLMLRTTVPDTVPSDAAVVLQLNSMACQASGSFGVTLPLC